MKKLVFAFVALLFVTSLTAQDHEKSYKKAKRTLTNYHLNPTDTDKLSDAMEKIDYALSGDLSGIKNPHDPYLVKGEIYNTIANSQISAATLAKQDPALAAKAGTTVEVDNPANSAYEALAKALELAEKKSAKKSVLKALYENQNYTSNTGIMAFEEKKYETAFISFENVVKAHDLIKSAGGQSTLDADGAYDNQLYLIGLAGLNAQKYDAAKPYLIKLYEKGTEEPLVYSSLYSIEAEKDMDAAYVYLEAGRKKFPEDNSLLFSEINHFLKLGKLDDLIGRLNTAIEKEPDNVSLYTTLGNVYDNLYQKEVEAGNLEKEKEYFDMAMKNYKVAVEKEPGNVDGHYSMGALYFNKAALVTQEMLKLNDDFSKEGMKKYESLKGEASELFKLALPHFKQAESLDPNDINTLIALKEIFARTDDIAKSNEFKDRMKTVQDGGTNPSSYFKQ